MFDKQGKAGRVLNDLFPSQFCFNLRSTANGIYEARKTLSVWRFSGISLDLGGF